MTIQEALVTYIRMGYFIDNTVGPTACEKLLMVPPFDKLHYMDLNDYLCGKRQNLAVNPPPRTIIKPKKKGLGL